jgi:hypothetical protein
LLLSMLDPSRSALKAEKADIVIYKAAFFKVNG